MPKIRLDDVVKYKNVIGIVNNISPNNICTIAEVKNRQKVHKLPIEDLELVARKGTKKYSMMVEGALPKNLPITKQHIYNAKKSHQEDVLSKLQHAYNQVVANRELDYQKDEDVSNYEPTRQDILDLIDLALDIGDKEMFTYYSQKLKEI